MKDVLEDEEDDLSCMFPNLAPSTAHQRGCRCPARCQAWRDRVDAEYAPKRNEYRRTNQAYKDRRNAYKRAARRRAAR